MKVFAIGILFLGFTSLSLAQEQHIEVQDFELEGVTITALNLNYLNKVHDVTTPETARALENTVARFDIGKAPGFENNLNAYKVYFTNSKGRIMATYNNKGKILASSEKFKDVTLPLAVRNSVYENYPDWTVKQNVYLVNYNHRKGVKKLYQFQIGKDRLKKNLKVDAMGNMIQ